MRVPSEKIVPSVDYLACVTEFQRQAVARSELLEDWQSPWNVLRLMSELPVRGSSTSLPIRAVFGWLGYRSR